jgi:two-component system chemotaxis response regulator CheY
MPRMNREGTCMARNVIIVDDSQYIVDVLFKFFNETMQFNVSATSTDSRDAVALFRHFKPDLLVLDICMPYKNGLEVIHEIISDFPDAKILMVSGVRNDFLLDCLQAGALDVISKPLTFQAPAFVEHFKHIVDQMFF